MIRISTDSCVDLTPQQIEEHHVAILPLTVTLDSESFLDGESIQPADIFAYVKKTKTLPKTAACSVEDFKFHFLSLLKGGNEVIHIGIGAKLSVSYENALQAAAEIGSKKLFIVDSASLSTGIGLQVLLAARLSQSGKTAQEICAILDETRSKVQASFVVDSVEYLYKGGRCTAMARFGANILHIKPRLELQDGAIINTGKYMGGLRQVLRKYIDDMLRLHPNPRREICFITHTCSDAALVAELVAYVENKGIFEQVISSRAGATISCHCGENTVGILYITC